MSAEIFSLFLVFAHENRQRTVNIKGFPNFLFVSDLREFAEEHLVDDLNPVASLSNVLSYIINIIEEVAKSIQQEVGLPIIFCHLWVGHDIDALMLYVHINILARHNGVAVVMDGSWITAMDM